jgi:hypothetical protein
MGYYKQRGGHMKALPYHQEHIIHQMKELAKQGFELTPAGANISFKPHAMQALLKKGLVREVERTRTRKDGGEWNYTAYELVGA